MSLFKSLFGNLKETAMKKFSSYKNEKAVPDNQISNTFSEEIKQAKDKINWMPLSDVSQLDEIVEFSNTKPVLIFKHSTRCSVSRMALKQFENEFDLSHVMDTYFLDLLEYRDVSNAIENRFQVVHQSPQLLLIRGGKSVHDVSHSEIDAIALKIWL